MLDLYETVVVEVRKETSQPLSSVLPIRGVIHANPMAERVYVHLVVFAKESNDPTPELPPAPFEARLCWHVGRGEVAGLVRTTPLAPRAAGLVTPWFLPASDAAEFHNRVVPDSGLAVG